MKGTKINCKVTDCHWNIGIDEKDNCCCPKVDISYDRVCQNAITKREAKRKIDAAFEKFRETPKGGIQPFDERG